MLPSSSVITGVASVTGRCSRYASMSPGHAGAPVGSLFVADHAQHRADAVHRLDVAQRVDRRRAGRPRGPVCVMKMSRASSPMPRCCIDLIDTPCCAELAGDRARARRAGRRPPSAGRTATRRSSIGRIGLRRQRRRSSRPCAPPTRFLAASTRSPSTADAVGLAAGAAPVEHELADRVALDEHRVERVAHRGERVVHRDHRRVHAHRDLAVELLGDREQLHDVAEVARRRDVVGGDLA